MGCQAWEVFGGESSEAAGMRRVLWAGTANWRMSPGLHPGAAPCTLVHPCLLLIAWLRGETACVTCQGTATTWHCLGSHPASISCQIHRGSLDLGELHRAEGKPQVWLLVPPVVAEPTQGCQLQSSEFTFKREKEII